MTLVLRGMKTQHEYAISEPVEHFGSASGVVMFYGDNTVMFNDKKLVQDCCFSSGAGEHPLVKWGSEMSNLGQGTCLINTMKKWLDFQILGSDGVKSTSQMCF